MIISKSPTTNIHTCAQSPRMFHLNARFIIIYWNEKYAREGKCYPRSIRNAARWSLSVQNSNECAQDTRDINTDTHHTQQVHLRSFFEIGKPKAIIYAFHTRFFEIIKCTILKITYIWRWLSKWFTKIYLNERRQKSIFFPPARRICFSVRKYRVNVTPSTVRSARVLVR